MDDWTLLAESHQSRESFSVLFDRHSSYVFRVALKLTANQHVSEDIVQEVFLRLFKKSGRFKRKAEFKTMLYSITLNVVREQWRKDRRLREIEKIVVIDSTETDNTQDLVRLHAALNTLPRKQREALVLRYYEELSVKDTAVIMGCREGTVKSNLHWAMKKLREYMKNEQ